MLVKTFSKLAIVRMLIPTTVKFVGSECFSGCLNLQTVEFLGENISLEKSCFMDSIKLRLVTFPNVKQIKIEEDAFEGVSEDFSLFLPNAVIIQFE